MKHVRSQDHEQEKVARLLGRLPTTEAPENFEAMVRTRIAERRSADSLGRPAFWLAVKFASPMILLLLLGVFLIFSDESTINVGMVPPIEAPSIASAEFAEDPPSNAIAENRGNSSRPVMSPDRDSRQQRGEQGGSQERSLDQDDTTMFPPGVDPRRANSTTQVPPSGGQISPSAILSMFGISTACADVGCAVVSVKESSIASRVGIAPGDLIEAIDDRQINARTSFAGSVTVSSLRIVRAGKRLTVVLSPR